MRIPSDTPIDRAALVARHSIASNSAELVVPLGNGGFCFSVDGTGLHTLAGNAMARWAWHSFPMPEGFSPADVPRHKTTQNRRNDDRPEEIPDTPLRKWMFDNPHSFSFARLSFRRGDGREISAGEIHDLTRRLDLWRGQHVSEFTLDDASVRVETVVHPQLDAVAVRIGSPLLADGRLKVTLEFGYPLVKAQSGWINDFADPRGRLDLVAQPKPADLTLRRRIDDTVFHTRLSATPNAQIRPAGPFAFDIVSHSADLELLCAFSAEPLTGESPSFDATSSAAAESWQTFWTTGGAVDLSASEDPRWFELERRIVLSQYNMNAQGAGPWPNAEIGLMGIDYWAGQFHMEMIWWHLAHYALWGRLEKADAALACYQTFLPVARDLAHQLHYKGAMWAKMVGPAGDSAPWFGNHVLLWKEPHPIFIAELEYRLRPTRATLDKWADIIDATAAFMADYPTRNADTGVYSLNPVMPPSETGVTRDTVFDLAYWRWGLAQAQVWRERMGRSRVALWDEVRSNLQPLPVLDGCYVHAAEWLETYRKRNWEHPDVVGVFGMLPPTDGVDPQIVARSLQRVLQTWRWETCWGWDFPWMAMAAARTHQPELALHALLLDTPKNHYDQRGICGGWYLPGNGGLLYAVAMMAAGWDLAPGEAPLGHAPGFPADGSWTVRHEGLHPAP